MSSTSASAIVAEMTMREANKYSRMLDFKIAAMIVFDAVAYALAAACYVRMHLFKVALAIWVHLCSALETARGIDWSARGIIAVPPKHDASEEKLALLEMVLIVAIVEFALYRWYLKLTAIHDPSAEIGFRLPASPDQFLYVENKDPNAARWSFIFGGVNAIIALLSRRICYVPIDMLIIPVVCDYLSALVRGQNTVVIRTRPATEEAERVNSPAVSLTEEH